jgi:ABC-type multidrug transport system fused ATPase/permease subunit
MTAEKPDSGRPFFYYGGLCRKVLVERALFSWFVVAAALHGLGHGLMAVAAATLGTAVASNSSPDSSFGFAYDPRTLALVGVAAAVAKGAGATVGATLQSRLAQNIAGWVRQDAAARLLAGGSSLPPGQLAARLSVGLRDVERGVEEGFLGAIRAGLALVPLGVAIALVSTKLAWAAVLLLGPFGALLSLARRGWKHAHARAVSVAEGLHLELDELVANMDVWRAYGAADPVCDTLRGLAQQAARATSRAEGVRAALSSANEVLAAVTLLGCIGAARWLSLPLGDGTLVAFAVPFFMAYRPLRELGDARAALERGEAALTSLERTARAAIVASPPAPAPIERGVQASAQFPMSSSQAARKWQRATLEVRGVGVRSGRPWAGSTDRLVLSASAAPLEASTVGHAASERAAPLTSFILRWGEMIAIVGPTGSGKTTLLRALLGLEPGAVGSIRYAGEDLSRAGVGPLERPFAWAPQEAPLLAGSLEKNVLFAPTDPSAAFDVLRSLGADRLSRECAGVNLGASGRPVSGGERKWIALARAIASELPVLLLDEPTAGLDVASQANVLAELERLRRTRAIIVVTHQHDVAARADRVLVIGSSLEDQNWANSRGSFSKSRRMSGMS